MQVCRKYRGGCSRVSSLSLTTVCSSASLISEPQPVLMPELERDNRWLVLGPSSHIEPRDDQIGHNYPYTILIYSKYTHNSSILYLNALIKIPINRSQQLLRSLLRNIMSTPQSLSRQFNFITAISLPDRFDVTIV